MCSSRKYPYYRHGGFFCFAPPLPPGNSSLFSYFSSKNLAFKTPLPLGISSDLPWGGCGFFLELHNLSRGIIAVFQPENFTGGPKWPLKTFFRSHIF